MIQTIPWGAVVISGCMIVYVIFLGFASYSPSFENKNFYGEYPAIAGNLPSIYRGMRSDDSNLNSSISTVSYDPWDLCDLPKYDVWDEEIIPYVNPNKDPLKDCDRTFKPFTELKNSSWRVVSLNKNLECKTRCHRRKSERQNEISKWNFTQGPVDCEFLEAVCSENKEDVYGYLHSQVIPKPPIEKPKIDTAGLMQFDVFVILLDSLSYSQGKRSLPRTLSYFTNHMDGVIFPYMNKIGENSRPNGIPIWFGKSLEKIDRSLFDEEVIPPDWSHKYFCKTFKDNETNIFSEFHDYGYRTLLAEDWAEGTMNWPNCVGFDKPPIDHFMRPFQNAYERKGQGAPITQKHLKGGKLCRQTHNTLLDYMGQFINAYPDQKKFGWVWAIDLGHNSENGFTHADKDFHNFLIEHRKKLDNSFVFLLGDHGLRFGGVRNTFVGALDVNNPFTAISIPKVLRNTTNILEYVAENAKNIQSHYDTRATILDIMKYQSAKSFTETEARQFPEEKGYSYIRKQPSTPRNCRNMPIPLEYCICQFKKSKVPRNTKTAKEIGKALAFAVNTQIEDGNFTGNCIKMEWEKTLSLEMYDHQFKGATLYTVTAQMKEPSKAEFKSNVKIVDGKIKVLGMVERSNRYGKTADCINENKLIFFEGWRSLTWVAYVLYFGAQWAIGAYNFVKTDEVAKNYFREEMILRYNVCVDNLSSLAMVAFDPSSGDIRWWNLMTVVNMSFIMAIQYAIMIHCGYSMFTKMEEKLQNFSTMHKNHHKQLFKTLMLQGLYAATICLIAIQFVYRYWAVFDENKLEFFEGWRSLIWVAYVLYFGAQWAIGAYNFVKTDEVAKNYFREEMILRYNVCVDSLPSLALVAFDPSSGDVRWWNLMTIANMYFIMTIQFVIMIHSGYSMFTKMEEKLQNFSTMHKNHHKQLFKTLMLQKYCSVCGNSCAFAKRIAWNTQETRRQGRCDLDIEVMEVHH
ncbi:hypothetical protein L3Y34_013064 [Caenorhabditis briggsae]|uniref:Uncharacterized protein n=1 Tax=Caenorhabditis briggsae TaxID=6238 RepID=A0AAE8ZXH7_CAEBR|nr:hypothetical protein L3Y34_013064 [Caenorhabditis briggsae]